MTTHDLSARRWGRNYEIFEIVGNGNWVRGVLWATPLPEKGDHLLLANPGAPDGKTRYVVEEITPYHDPRDMAQVVLGFAPREHQT